MVPTNFSIFQLSSFLKQIHKILYMCSEISSNLKFSVNKINI